MAYVITNNQHYINIANAIRNTSFGEIEGPMPPHEFAQRIEEISAIGQEQGRVVGYAQGFEAGKESSIQSEYDRFWDGYQAQGSRREYQHAFAGIGWTDEVFKPKYDLILSGNCGNMFQNSRISNIYEQTIGRGLKFTMSNLTYAAAMFSYASAVTHIPAISLVGITDAYSLFAHCYSLVAIDELAVSETFGFRYIFDHCTNLENLTMKGTIGKNGLNLSWSAKLTHNSLMSVINALADKSTDTSGTTWAVTLGTENLAKLTDAEKAIATQRGWTLV